MTRPDLRDIVDRLGGIYPETRAFPGALGQIVWDNVGYLIDDELRGALYAEFVDRVGLDAKAIAAADGAMLFDIARKGRMRPETRVDRLRSIGEIVLKEAGGDLDAAIRNLPLAKARKLLKLFPGVGEPGADRILLFSGVSPRPSVDSNGLRVLVRLGVLDAPKSYDACYRAAIQVLGEAGQGDFDWLRTAWRALRDHGRTLCRRKDPLCVACPLDPVCAHRHLGVLF